jgi:4-amino-4-deoxy-L-arabinose transferase-like glycosyltransferase
VEAAMEKVSESYAPAHSSNELPAWTDQARRADRLAGTLLGLLLGAFAFFVSRQLGVIPAPALAEGALMRMAAWNAPGTPVTIPAVNLALGVFVKIFGMGVAQARSWSVLAALLLLLAVFLIGRKLHSRAAGLLAVALLIFDTNFFQATRTVRPEIPASACALGAAYFYLRAQAGANVQRKWLWGVTAGVLAAAAGLFHPSGWYAAAALLVWSVVQRGDIVRSVSWWSFSIGAAIPGLPFAVYVWRRFDSWSAQWRMDAQALHPGSPGNFYASLSAEWGRYGGWSEGLLPLPTPGSLAVQFFQSLTVAALVYLLIRTLRTAYQIASHWRLVSDLYGRFGGMPAPHELEELYESGEFALPASGSLQAWMFEKGGLMRRLSLAVKEIEKDSQPITHWLQVLGAPSHPAWRVPRTGLLFIVVAATAWLTVFDGYKSPSGLVFLTPWFALACGVALTDGLRWATAQRSQSAGRVLYGLAVWVTLGAVFFTCVGSASRVAWRFYRWSRTFEPAPYADIARALQRVTPPGVTPVGSALHWMAFPEREYLPYQDWIQNLRTDRAYALITDDASPWRDQPDGGARAEGFAVRRQIAEFSNTLYGSIKVYYLGPPDAQMARAPVERYYFLGGFERGFSRRGYYNERQRQEAAVVWLAEPAELERLAKTQLKPGERPPEMQREGGRVALRIVTDVSNFNTRIRFPMPPLKPNTLYRLQTAVHVTEGGGLIGPRDHTGLWLAEPIACQVSAQYTPIDMVFSTNARGDGELAVGNRRNQPAASLIYLGQVELREIGPRL